MASVTPGNAVVLFTGDFTTKLGSETFALMHAAEDWRTVS
jgi:hypothetical protein